MAGSTKVAVLATLMFAMLLSGSVVDGARPIVSEGSAVAADRTLMTGNGRQLKTIGLLLAKKCWLFPWLWYCGPKYAPVVYTPRVVVQEGDDDDSYVTTTAGVAAGGDIRVRARDGAQVTVQGRRLNWFIHWPWHYKVWGFRKYDKYDGKHDRRLQGHYDYSKLYRWIYTWWW